MPESGSIHTRHALNSSIKALKIPDALRLHWPLKHTVIAAVLLTAAAHLLFLGTVRGADEGGYAMVARYAHDPGPYLYGPLFVDRPPLLVELFRAALWFGSAGTVLLGTVAAIICVLACARTAYLIAGPRAARWAAVIAAAIGSSPLLQAEHTNGEILAAALVTSSIACALDANRLRRTSRWLSLSFAVASGGAAMAAPFIKQNFVDALAFAVAMALAQVATRRRTPWTLYLAYVAGAAVVLGWAFAWSQHHHGLGALWYAMYGVRADATNSILGLTSVVQLENIAILIVASLASGVLFLALAVVSAHWRRGRRRFPAIALGYAAALLVELVGIVGGGNFASHYLIGLISTTPVCTGIMIANWRDGGHLFGLQWVRLTSVVIVASCLITAPVSALAAHTTQRPVQSIAQWLKAAASPDDSVVVPFSNSPVIDVSGLRPAYPYNWMLLVRTRDPQLRDLLQLIDGPSPPTWVVEWDDPDVAGFASAVPLPVALVPRYTMLGKLCGHQIWLLKGHQPRVALNPDDCG